MGVLPTFGGLPYTAQPIGLMSVPAPPATSQSTATMQVPMAPQPSTVSSSTSNFSVPIRGRDVPHRQSRARSQAPGAWHQDRAGNTWQDDRQQGLRTAQATHGKIAASKAQTDRGTAGTTTPGTATGGKAGETGAAVTGRDGTTTNRRPAEAEHSPTGTTPRSQHRMWTCNEMAGNGHTSSTKPSCTAAVDGHTTEIGSPANSSVQFSARQRTATTCALHATFPFEILKTTTTVVTSAVTADRSSSGAKHGTKPD